MTVPAIALRPLLPADVPALAALFRASIATLGADDYNEAQCDAWAARADDEAAFGQRLLSQLTLVATVARQPVGFASLDGPDRIGFLYVDPGHVRQGVASQLLDALSRLAGARGAARLVVDASDTARDFFLARGFTPTVRNMVPVDDEWLGNTTMERKLAPVATGLPEGGRA